MNKPDMTHVMTDYRNRDREEDQSFQFKTVDEHDQWIGLYRRGLTRLARYVEKRRMMVELAITWPKRREFDVESDIAESFDVGNEPPPIERDRKAKQTELGESRWRAFGLDVIAPAGWTLTRTEVKPADTTFFFQDLNDSNRRAQIRRAGMIDAWFDGSLETFIRRYVGVGPEIDHEPLGQKGRTALLSQCIETATKFERISGRAPVRRDLSWVDRDAHAVICVTTWSAGKKHTAEPRIFDVTGVSTL